MSNIPANPTESVTGEPVAPKLWNCPSYERAQWHLIPDYMRGGLRRYIEDGIPPGSFLTAVITNDLREAVGRADDTNVERLHLYVRFLYGCAPSPCWGSVERFSAWTAGGGLNGGAAQ